MHAHTVDHHHHHHYCHYYHHPSQSLITIIIIADTLANEFDKQGNVWAFNFAFPQWYQFDVIPTEAVQNAAWTLFAVFLVVVIFIAHAGMALIVTCTVALVLLDIVGYMHYWDVSLNAVSVINLVLAIGLSVDYSVHVAHAFMHKQGTKTERARLALGEMGVSVINGAISTFLAVSVLSQSKSYVFEVFFKMFFLTCVVGAGHGLIVLPVVLSLCGPRPHPEHDGEDGDGDDRDVRVHEKDGSGASGSINNSGSTQGNETMTPKNNGGMVEI